MSVVIVGCGYVGLSAASRFKAEGEQVFGLVRSPESAEQLAASHITAIVQDLDAPPEASFFAGVISTLCYFAPPPNAGITDARLTSFLEQLERVSLPQKIIYISTSGVYGDHAGAWVDEESELKPLNDRSRRRLNAEEQLLDFSRRHNLPVVLFRVPGIYGPGRIPVDRVASGAPVLKESEAPVSNRIHVNDLVEAVVLASKRCDTSEIFNISDGVPGTMTDYFNRVADAYSLPSPPQITMAEAEETMSPGLLSYFRESRRVDISKAKKLLGYCPDYPDLFEALCLIRKTE